MRELGVQLLLAVVPAVLAITCHEVAHGYAALLLGDDTAQRMGRLSLNPLRHVDRVGTILVPALLLLGQLATIGRVAVMFGWAKPVPIAAWRFRDPRRGMMLVAAAGPAVNFVLAWAAALALHAAAQLPPVAEDAASECLFYLMLANLVLGLFNLLPVLPLDGGRIVAGLLPESLARHWARLEPAGVLAVLVGAVLLPQLLRAFGVAFDPIGDTLQLWVPRIMAVVLRLAGHDA